MRGSSGSRRPKRPEAVRRALIEGAATLAVEQGLAGVTVQAVAAAAGVTKGGLFHHFPNKQALVEAMFADLLARVDVEIDARIAADPVPHGRFTRAYVEATFVGGAFGFGSPWSALSVAMLAEPSLRTLWSDWLAARLERHRDTDRGPALDVVRCAADGVWLAHTLSSGPALDHAALHAHLVAMTAAPAGPEPRADGAVGGQDQMSN